MKMVKVKLGYRSHRPCGWTPKRDGFALTGVPDVPSQRLQVFAPEGKTGIDIAVSILKEQSALDLARHDELRQLARMILAVENVT